MWGLYLASAAAGYLLGSFPTGYLAGRWHGIDVREHGSGNIGATNVTRVLGKRVGFLVFAGDAAKGWMAVLAGHALVAWGRSQGFWHGYSVIAGILAGMACILGHNFPVWLGFRGGKGIATTTGVLLGLMPVALAASGVVWAAAFLGLRYVSVASLLAAATLPLSVGLLWYVGHANVSLFWFSLAATGLAFWRHRANIHRLMEGTEPRFAPKPRPEKV